MNSTAYYVLSFVMALFLHGGVIALMLMNWEPEKTIQMEDNRIYYMEANVVAENPHTAKKEQDKKATAQRNKKRRDRLAAENATRLANINREKIKIKALQEAAKLKALEDQKNRVVIQDQSAIIEAERQNKNKANQLEAERRQMEMDLDAAIQGEQLALRAITDDEKASAFAGQIQREIIQNWSRPPSARNGMQAILRVFLVPTGDVVNVVVEESSGNDAFDRSALLAVNKARRFLVPSESRQFEKNFRQFVVLFRPEDLRL